jgi:hypothetical protein
MYEPIYSRMDANPAAIHYTAPKLQQPPQIEAAFDRGVFIDLIVKCSDGTAIMTYSKVEKVFCSPKGECGTQRDAVIKNACR